ncbi:hypothetical protein ACFV4N_28560 [Actinosynnema sp. NPDC059797]
MTRSNDVRGDVHGSVHQSRDHVHRDTHAYEVRGPNTVNSGPGTQINHFHDVVRRKRREARLVADDHVRALADRFVRPGRFPEHLFAEPGAVVLAGPPGTGCRTAALMLLTAMGTTGLDALRELPDRPGDPEEAALDPEDFDEDDRLLLDLTALDREGVVRLRPDLEAVRSAVAAKRARLAVVARRDQEDLLGDSLVPLVVRLDPPPAVDVLKAHLGLDDLRVPDDVHRHLAGASPGEAADLARLTREARDAEPHAGVAAWLRAAKEAQTHRDEVAADLFREHRDGATRALAVAAAFLSGAPLEALARAEAHFRRLVELPEDDTHLLEGPYLAERMTRVGLRTGGARAIGFTSLALDAAVRTHFWTYFPRLRDRMPDWVEVVVGLREVDDPSAASLVARFADQALATGRVEHLTALARRWGGGDRPDLALQVLTTGLEHHGWGAAFRDEVYRRARGADLSPQYAQVLITACVAVIAPNRPTEALVRLHHLTRHRDEAVRGEAREALLDLVRRRGLHRWLLHRLVKYGVRRTDHAIVHELDVPPAAARGRRARHDLVAVWGEVLAAGAGAVPGHVLGRLLDRDPVLLVDACAGRVRPLNDLYLAVLERVRDAPGAEPRASWSARARRLRRHIDLALGIPHVEDGR